MLMHSSLIVRELECSAFIRSIVLFIVLLYFVISNDRIPNSAESFGDSVLVNYFSVDAFRLF